MRENTILVVVDPAAGERQSVLERAVWLAKQSGARLELFTCEYDADLDSGQLLSVWVPDPSARERLLDRRRQQLEALAKPLRDSGLTVTVEVAWDHPLDAAVVAKASAHDYW